LQKFKKSEGVLYAGKAQEKTRIMRTQRRLSKRTGATYPWIVQSTAVVNHYHFYGIDVQQSGVAQDLMPWSRGSSAPPLGHLGERELRLQDRQLVAIAGGATSIGQWQDSAKCGGHIDVLALQVLMRVDAELGVVGKARAKLQKERPEVFACNDRYLRGRHIVMMSKSGYCSKHIARLRVPLPPEMSKSSS